MGIKLNTPRHKIKALIDETLRRKETIIIRNLSYLGESCVNVAKGSDEYYDQTGNLRSSLGWMILYNGKIIKSGGFEVVKNGKKGSEQGKSFINNLVSKYGKGYVLLVVAGMNYAAHVEATNRDVLTSAELYAKDKMPSILRQLKLS